MRSDRISVLIVDDERFYRDAILDILVAEGFDCQACEDGEGALKLLAGRAFSVAIVDMRLPGSSGVEVLQQLRAARHEMRVIMLSEQSDQERVLDALRSGARDYLAKPLHDEELVLAVRRAANDHATARDYISLCHRVDDLAIHLDDFNCDLSAAPPGGELQTLYAASVELVSRALEVDKTSLLLLDPRAARLNIVAATGRDLDPAQMVPVRMGEGLVGRCLEDLGAMVVGDTRSESHFAADLTPERYRGHSFAIAPLAIGERPFGVLCATDRSDGTPLRHQDLAMLRLISAQVVERLSALQHEAGRPVVEVSPGALRPSVEVELGEELAEELPESLSGSFEEPTLVKAPPEPEASDAAVLSTAPDDSRTVGEPAREFASPDDRADEGDAELVRLVCDAMVHEVEPTSLLRTALRALESELEADPASLYLIDSNSGELVREAAGGRGLRLDHERLATGRGLTGTVLQRGQLVASAEPASDPRFDAAVDAPMDGQPGPLLLLPLQMRGKTIGLARLHLAEGASVSARTGEVLVAALSAAVRNVLLYRNLLESIEEVAVARRESRS